MPAGKLLVLQRDRHILTLLLSGNRLLAANACLESEDSLIGNIYIGKIQNIAENLEAAFVEITKGVLCFLPLSDVKKPILTNRAYDGRLKSGDELLVQVNRDALKTKLPSVTTQLSLSGQYCVLASGSNKLGISGKLPSEMKSLLQIYLQQAGLALEKKCRQKSADFSYGFVVRTNAGTLEDFAPLSREWNNLEEEYLNLLSVAVYRPCYTCLKRNPAAWLTRLPDFYITEYEEIITDIPGYYELLQEYRDNWLLNTQIPIRLYEDNTLSLHKLYSVETHLANALDKKVWLKSGGYLIIEPTEALTVIDVNSGKFEARRGTSESAFHKINMEAAEEIALQLRLRNLSGIIIIDFINVGDAHKKELLTRLQSLVKKDSVKTNIIDITPLGLMEITRKKLNRPLAEQLK